MTIEQPIDRRLDTLERFRRETETRAQKTDKQIEDIHHTLYGNGQPGWDEMIRTLYDDYLKRKAAEEEANKEARRIDKEAKFKGMEITSNQKIAIIGGLFVIVNSVVTWMLTKP